MEKKERNEDSSSTRSKTLSTCHARFPAFPPRRATHSNPPAGPRCLSIYVCIAFLFVPRVPFPYFPSGSWSARKHVRAHVSFHPVRISADARGLPPPFAKVKDPGLPVSGDGHSNLRFEKTLRVFVARTAETVTRFLQGLYGLRRLGG